MRISDLSQQTGVSVATIKFYLREGLLPPGEPTGRNQAQYGEVHQRRLWLIRALTGIGQLNLSSVGELIATIEDDNPSTPALFETVNRVLDSDDGATHDRAEQALAHQDVNRFLDEVGWCVRTDAPGRERLAEVLAALQRLGCGYGVELFLSCARAAEDLTRRELDALPGEPTAPDRAAAVARAVLLDAAFGALHRMAQEHLVRQRYGSTATERDRP
jgi:DNA-binding transcriptional MerR regulator